MGLLLHLLIIIMSALVVHGARQMQSWATVPGPSGSQLGLGAGVGGCAAAWRGIHKSQLISAWPRNAHA